jgi:hypothetical protein
MRRLWSSLLIVGLLAGIAPVGQVAAAAGSEGGATSVRAYAGRGFPTTSGDWLNVPPKHSKYSRKADSQVARVLEQAESGGPVAALQSARSGGLRVSGDKIRVIVETSDLAQARASVAKAGAIAGHSSANLLQVSADPAQLEAILDAPGVSYVRAPLPYRLEAVDGEGVETTNALAVQLAGDTGAGVKIGIIDGGFAGLADAQANGDLPGSATVVDYCDGFTEETDHGTAVAEIVHEMAPDAQLYLICFYDEVSLADAEGWARTNGISIINHSVGWYNSSRGDGSGAPGTPDATAADASSNGILWVNSAGNDAQVHWTGHFVGVSGDVRNYFAAGDTGNDFWLGSNQEVCAALKWDDWPLSDQDYDLYIVRSSDQWIVAWSENEQVGNIPPTEDTCFLNSGAGQYYFIGIVKYAATSTPRFDLFVWGTDQLQYRMAAGSVVEPASSPAAFAAGAECWQGTAIEPFSSQGPTISGVQKPDITAPDQVSTFTYGHAGTTCDPYGGFAGTSASAPHVAGAAALVKAAHPSFTVAQLKSYLQTYAKDQGAAGPDNVYGAGLLYLPARPLAPGAVTGIGYNQSVKVSWTAPTSDGGSPVTGYTVTAAPGGATCTTTGALSCTVIGLTNGTPYTFIVTATNAIGTSDPSAPSAAVTPVAVPDAPVVTAIGYDGRIDVRWTAPNDNGSPITSYRVDVSPGGNFCSTAGLACGFSGLTNHVTYTVSVYASNANGNGPPAVTTATPRVGNTYVPLIPTRILDTAVPIGNTEGTPIAKAQIPAQVPLTFDVANQYPGDSTRNVPTNATAVTGVLSVVGGPVNGYLGLTPEPMTIPNISNLNFPPHDRRSTGVTITLGHDATLSVSYAGTTKGAVDIAFDVTGYFVEGTSGATYNAVTPTRILDSRHGFGQAGGKPAKFASGVHQCFPVAGLAGVPTAAVAVTGNLTVTHQSSAGLATVGPEPDDAPTTATVYAPRWTSKVQDNRATGVTIKLDSGGSLCAVWVGAAGSTADVIFDVNGYFVPGGGGAMYVPITPNRIYDTRRPFPSSARILVGRYGQMFTVVNQKPTDPTQNVPSDAVAVTGTLTVTRQKKLGYLSLTTTQYKYPSVPSTSTLNFLLDNRATGVTVPLGSGGRLGIFYGPYKGVTCHAIFDVSGYFVN